MSRRSRPRSDLRIDGGTIAAPLADDTHDAEWSRDTRASLHRAE